jgi:hypothetical protein
MANTNAPSTMNKDKAVELPESQEGLKMIF